MSIPTRLAAHGENERQVVFASPIGSYRLDVWISPSVLRAGEIHLETLITNHAEMPIRECDVEVTISPLHRVGDPIFGRAGPSEIANGFRQEIILQIADPGAYQVQLRVLDSDVLVDELSFQLEVVRTAGWVKVLILMGVALSFIIGIWLLREGWLIWSARGTEIEHRFT